MKNSISKPFFLSCLLFLSARLLAAPYIQPVRTLDVPAREVQISFDGIDDETSWSSAQTLTRFNPVGWDGTDADLSGYFKICWDTRYLYFYANITDDVNHSYELAYSSPWMFDCIEMHINLDTLDNELHLYDFNTIQLRMNRGIDSLLVTGRANASQFCYYWNNKSTGNGWVVEAAIPWACALPSGSLEEDIMEYIDNSMGFDVAFSDSDNSSGDVTMGSRDLMMAWDSDDPNNYEDRTEDNAWNNILAFGIIDLIGTPGEPQAPCTPAAPPYYKPVNKVYLPSRVDEAVIDGMNDEESYGETLVPTLYKTDDYNGLSDLSGFCQAFWDSTFLYLYAAVQDDIGQNWQGTGDPRDFDNIGLFIDLDTSHTSSVYDENAIQLLFCRGLDSICITGRAEQGDFNYFFDNTETSWTVETAIPWTCLLPEGSVAADIIPYLQNRIGFDFTFNDFDNAPGQISAKAAWDLDGGLEDSAWVSTYALGILNLIDAGSVVSSPYIPPVRTMDIPARSDTLIFDGFDNESTWSEAQVMTIFDATGLTGGDADLSGYFKVSWDLGFLYFYADITDDVDHSYDVSYNDSWMFDCIEFHIDLDTNHQLSYYDNNTIQLRMNRGVDTFTVVGRADSANQFYLHWHNKPAGNGWVVEAGVPWLCVLPYASLPEDIEDYITNRMGFDIAFSDSDDADGDPLTGDRDAMAAWDSDDPDTPEDRTEDNAWNNTHAFGIVRLIGNPLPQLPPPPPRPVDISPSTTTDLILYPNPAEHTIYLSGNEEFRYLEIINVNGQVLRRIDFSGSNCTIDVSDLNSGLYVMRIITQDDSIRNMKFTIQ